MTVPMHPALAFNLGGWEIALIAFVALLLFGTRLPAVARSMGRGINEFKKGLNEPLDDEPAAGPPATRSDEGEDAVGGRR